MVMMDETTHQVLATVEDVEVVVVDEVVDRLYVADGETVRLLDARDYRELRSTSLSPDSSLRQDFSELSRAAQSKPSAEGLKGQSPAGSDSAPEGGFALSALSFSSALSCRAKKVKVGDVKVSVPPQGICVNLRVMSCLRGALPGGIGKKLSLPK